MKNLATAACCLVAASLSGGAIGQDPPPPRSQTTFKSGVDLVPLDVSVIGRDGRPIDNLTAADFSLTVDAKPRRIVSAEYVRLAGQSAPPSAATHYSTNANAGSARLVMLVVDQGNISAGRARATIESATRFIKRLSPADRIALFVVPGPGPQINFTSNHALIRAQLPRIVGQASGTIGPQRLGLGESSRIERGDQLALASAGDRECTGGERQMCLQELNAEAREIIGEARNRARNSIGALRALMQQLSASRSPKTLVFLSEALVIDQDRSDLAWVGPLAAKGHVTLHVLRIDPPGGDAGTQRRSTNRGDDMALAEEGLSLLAGLTRGSLFRVVSNADNIFNRLALEISGYYLLGFEPEQGDRDGKPHKIKIAVPGRRDIEVRARQEFDIEAPRVQADQDVLAETLRAPLLATEIGLKVTAYTFREAASDKLRIVVAADIDRSLNPTGQVAIGYALMDGRGNVVSTRFEPRLETPVRGDTMVQRFVAAATGGAPGVYGLKLAVVDDTGRRGSVEHAFKAQLTAAGQMRTGDLLIGEDASAGAGPGGAAPAVAAEFLDADTLHGYLELYAESPDALKGASVTLEVASGEDSRALESVPARIDDAPGPRRVVEGAVPIALLPPGEYQARAVVSIGGRRAAQIVRPFRVARSANATDVPVRNRGRARAVSIAPFSSRVDSFQRATVLAPEVVGFFVDRMAAGNRAAVPPDAVEHARAGRFDAALDAARGSGHALATAFLQGMALYARGELEAAAVKFRESLRIDSEFFPAAFYLGACYAAGGLDREASAAWQTSLVTESDAPFVYTLLGDALLRQREIDQALEILNEAMARWPADPQVQMRLGAALAMAGKSTEALRVLDAYLDKHPGDPDRLFLAMRVIYEAHAGGRTIDAAQEDRARFDRYAAAYAAAAGPQPALVEQWKKFMGRQ